MLKDGVVGRQLTSFIRFVYVFVLLSILQFSKEIITYSK